MKKFMLLFLAPVPAEDQMKVSADEMKKGMEPWFAWFGKYGDAVVDKGMPVGKGFSITKSGSGKRQTQVAGYSFIQAADMEAAKAMVTNHPHLMFPNASIEVLEVLEMPGM